MLERSGLRVDAALARFVEEQVLPPIGLDAAAFWSDFARLVAEFAPRNRALLARRDDLQAQIDAWHLAHAGKPIAQDAYQAFLREIGYLVPEPAPFVVGTRGVDAEIATMAGPQLVVPVLNARFLLNAANARWGSLYDAFYGTDALDAAPAQGKGYDAVRGAAVIAAGRAFLDKALPLAEGSWADVAAIDAAAIDPACYVGETDSGRLYRSNGLGIEIVVDPASPVGSVDRAGIADIMLEAALTTIVDLEDSVAAVDAGDKLIAYANWLGLIRGDLTETFEKGGRVLT